MVRRVGSIESLIWMRLNSHRCIGRGKSNEKRDRGKAREQLEARSAVTCDPVRERRKQDGHPRVATLRQPSGRFRRSLIHRCLISLMHTEMCEGLLLDSLFQGLHPSFEVVARPERLEVGVLLQLGDVLKPRLHRLLERLQGRFHITKALLSDP
jgi:hypothetical protein